MCKVKWFIYCMCLLVASLFFFFFFYPFRRHDFHLLSISSFCFYFFFSFILFFFLYASSLYFPSFLYFCVYLRYSLLQYILDLPYLFRSVGFCDLISTWRTRCEITLMFFFPFFFCSNQWANRIEWLKKCKQQKEKLEEK